MRHLLGDRQLDGLVEALLLLESRPNDVPQLNEAFRLVHSIKGSSAMMGLDGITVQYDDWWFNVRPSNTEPLLRLVVEARTPADLDRRLGELVARIGTHVHH